MSALPRIDFLSPPFSGHLHPILGMARFLAGEYAVRVLSTAAVQPAIAASGVAGTALGCVADSELRGIVEPEHAVGSHPARLHRQFRRTLEVLRRLRDELRVRYAGERPDLLIADFTLPVAGVVAAEYGIPWWTSLPSPCVLETPDGPPAYVGGWGPARSAWERARNAAGRKAVRVFKRVTFHFYRRQIAAAGVKRLYRPDGTETVYSPERVLALGMRELEFERTWPPAVTFLGPVLFTPSDDFPDPPFEPGMRHVLVTLGTHLHWLKDRVAAEALRAAERMPGVCFHFSEGGREGALRHDGRFARLPSISYEKHLARYDLVVHHGGAGVMYHCLRHGKPSVVFPVDYDQFDHAARLEAAGCSLRLRNLSELEGAVRAALASGELRGGCERLRRRLAEYRPEEALRGLVSERLRG